MLKLRANPGGMLIVSGFHAGTPGKFLEIVIESSGVPGRPITIKSDPADPAVFERAYLVMDGREHIVFDGLGFMQTGQIRSQGSKNITFKKCNCVKLDQTQGNIVLMELFVGNDDWLVDRCYFRYCGNAIYARSSAQGAANRLKVIGSTFQDIGVGEWAESDGHCVGIQGGKDHQILNNTMDNCNTALEFWETFTRPMTGGIVRGNRISNCHEVQGGATGTGIALSGTSRKSLNLPKVGDRAGFIVENNRVTGAVWGYSCNYRDRVIERNNQFIDCSKGERRIFNPFANQN